MGEIFQYSMGWRKDRLDHRDRIYRHQLSIADGGVDESINYMLSTLPAMQFPIYNQGQTSSCVAQATARNVQYLMRAQGVENFIPSRLFIYWCARAAIGEQKRDEGCEIRDAYNTIAAFGVPLESEWPFGMNLVTKKPFRNVFKHATQHIALVRQSVPQKLDHILNCLKHRLPIVFGTTVFDFWENSDHGIMPMPMTGAKPEGGHAIMITGWIADKKLFQFANSWGSKWGMNGYGYLPADYVLDPDLSADFWSAFLMSKTSEESRR